MGKIKKIALVNPPLIGGGSVRRIMPPLGLMYLGAVLIRRGYEIDIIDSPLEGYDNINNQDGSFKTYGLSNRDLIKRLEEFNPDIIGISSSFSSRHKLAKEISRISQEALGVPIVMGGLDATINAQRLLAEGNAKYIVRGGYAENTLSDLLDILNKGEKPESLPGVSYKQGGEVFSNPCSNGRAPLDDIPFPARDSVSLEDYFKIGIPFAPFARSERADQLITSRGCPLNCVFCSTKPYWGKYNARSPTNVLEEVQEMIEKYGVEEIQIVDDNLTLDRERAFKIFKGLEQFNLYLCTPNGIMVNTLDERMIKSMARAGFYQICLPIESGSKRVREKIIGKRVPDKKKVKELVKVARDNGIQTHGFFVIGFPGETKEEIHLSLKYPWEVDFDSVSFFTASPLPGSRLYKDCLRKRYLVEEEATGSFRDSKLRIPHNSPDYYGMSPEQLDELIDSTTNQFHQEQAGKYPEAYRIKFANFLKIHPEFEDMFGRVH